MSELSFRQQTSKTPFGIRLLQWIGRDRTRMYRTSVLVLTFFAYMTYHLSRKTISVVKGTLNSNCSDPRPVETHDPKDHGNLTTLTTSCHGWHPFDSDSGNELLGALDLAFLFSYAVGMFISGFIAEHMDIRHFLTVGMLASGACSMLFGFGYFWNIHKFGYFVTVQIFFGFFQSSGWPSVVECVGNWFGKGRRGLIMGIWNSHTSVGNILGSAIPGIWASNKWGWSFIVPGIIIAVMGIVVFLFLVVDPVHVGCPPPDQHTTPSPAFASRESISSEPEETESLLNGPATKTSAGRIANGKKGETSRSSSEEFISNGPGINRTAPPVAVLSDGNPHAVGFLKALLIPGVIEYSLCLFFAKLVSYTFLFWLPFYLENTNIGGRTYGPETSADLSTFFDFGGILGGILAGVISDKTNCSGITVVVMLFLAGPMLFIYRFLANANLKINVFLMFLSGVLVNGPYALITTAVSANLGTHECLQGNTKAMAIVTAIIDGTGSMGAALGPLLTGIISPTGWNNVYYMLIAADVMAALLLSRQVWFELCSFCLPQSRRTSRSLTHMEAAYNSLGNEEYPEGTQD